MHRGQCSLSIVSFGRFASIGEKLAHQIKSLEFISDSIPELLTGQQNKTIWRLEQDESDSLRKPGSFAYFGWQHDAAPISHDDNVCPTHVSTVPSR
jgi:hypothetical protein